VAGDFGGLGEVHVCVLCSLSLVLPVMRLAPSLTFGGIVHEEQVKWNVL
jgi:hypothetical protein